MGPYILVIDQGTTSSRAIVFDTNQAIVGLGKMDFTQHYPAPGWVEHIPEEIWATCLWACKTALRKAGITAKDVAAIGITNQRETTVVWDRATGKAIYNAIVWQDRRTADACAKLREAGKEEMLARRTGLLLDPYFSGPKAQWILDNVEGARERALKGDLAFGTVDSFLIHRLTGGRVHATDATNASRTALFNIETNQWDPDLLDLFEIPANILPTVRDSADDYGSTDPDVLGAAIPIHGVIGDQQASLIGQACFLPGMMKSTYGTSCFALLNTGTDLVRSKNRMLSTIAYRLDGRSTYALEGVIFTVGGAVQWLRDDLGVLEQSSQGDAMAIASDPDQPIYLVPAFNGLGAPWWDNDARGAIYGLTRGTRRAELVRAALEAVGYQTRDLIDAMREDWSGAKDIVLRVDGGMVASNWTMQFIADVVEVGVDRPIDPEITARGAAWLAGWKAGVWPDAAGFAGRRESDRQFWPVMPAETRQSKLLGWREAVQRTLSRQPT
ncbi:MAG: glpK [Devosia sp.]|uniref:glycerol kinase GlpK n=1 Tax=Devosia sp. TaxID=1871048 RepID=UPI00263731A6|nr:glycerol kinase GlpK [Devosia sp.]MDB5587239.1 glpK [Devosia sp.]